MRIDQSGHVLVLTLDRPEKRNTLDRATIAGLREACARAVANKSIRVMRLQAEGKIWCAGADLASMASHPEGSSAAIHEFADAVADLAECEVPVVAAVNGGVLGGGVALLCAADLAIATQDSTVSLPESGVGVWPMMVGALLPRVATLRVAMDLALTGRRVLAEEAKEYGLFSSVVDSDRMEAVAEAVCAQVATKSPHAVRAGRQAWKTCLGEPELRARLHQLADQLQALVAHPDAAEGIAAFFEKRPPKWSEEA